MRVSIHHEPRAPATKQHQESNATTAIDKDTIPSPTSFCTNRHLTKTLVPASHGHALPISRDTRFRIVDLHGEQVVDLFAWVSSNTSEYLSPAYTRYHLSGVAPAVGECLYSNGDNPILRVVADTVKVHDMTFMACFPKLYTDKGQHNHRSCAQNVVEAMATAGYEDVVPSVLRVPEPFNCFQNTPNYSLKAMGSSKPGDYIEFEAMADLVVAISCCPYEIGGFNGGRITDVAIVTSEEKRNY